MKMTREQVIREAKATYEDDDITIYQFTKPREVEGGWWVDAAVWVPDENAEEPA